MAVGLAVAISNNVLDALCRNTAVTELPLAAFWVKLHITDPGAAGTNGAAGNTTRKQVTFSAAANGAITNSGAVTWTSGEVTTSEDYAFFSIWTASTAGTFRGSGTITANAVTAGDQFTIPIGDFDLTLSTAA